ncbi:MAG: hypothetical protein ACPHM3_04985 [Candidatus Kariarchaeum pelagius]
MGLDNWEFSSNMFIPGLWVSQSGNQDFLNYEENANIKNDYQSRLEYNNRIGDIYSIYLILQFNIDDSIRESFKNALKQFQNIDVNSNNYGAIVKEKNNLGNSENSLTSALMAFDLADKLDIPFDEIFDIDAFLSYFTQFFATYSDGEAINNYDLLQEKNVLNLNYTAMFKSFPGGNLPYEDLLRDDCCDDPLTSLYSGLGLIFYLDSYYDFSFYDLEGGLKLAEFWSYNTYWSNSNDDVASLDVVPTPDDIAHVPTHKLLGYQGELSTLISLSIIANFYHFDSITLETIEDEMRYRVMKTGGMSYVNHYTSTVESNIEAMNYLINLDPENLTYVNQETIMNFLSWIDSRIYNLGESYLGTIDNVVYEHERISFGYGSDLRHMSDQTSAINNPNYYPYEVHEVFKIINQLDISLDAYPFPAIQDLYENTAIYWEWYSLQYNPFNDIGDFNPNQVNDWLDRSDIFDFDFNLDSTEFLSNLEYFKNLDGSFSSYIDQIGYALERSREAINLGILDDYKMYEYLKLNLKTTDDKQGWGYYPDKDISSYSTAQILSAIKNTNQDSPLRLILLELDYEKVLNTIIDILYVEDKSHNDISFDDVINTNIWRVSQLIDSFNLLNLTLEDVTPSLENKNININETIRYYSYMQLKEDNGNYPAGMFAYRIDNGNLQIENYNPMQYAYHYINALDFFNSLGNIDLSLTRSFVEKMYITPENDNNNNEYYWGMFRNSLNDNYGSTGDPFYYGIKLSNIVNFTMTYNISKSLNYRFNHLLDNSDYEARSWDLTTLISFSAHPSVNIETLYQYASADRISSLMQSMTNSKSYTFTEPAYLESTLNALKAMHNLGFGFGSEEFNQTLNLLIKTQILTDDNDRWNYGAFPYNFNDESYNSEITSSIFAFLSEINGVSLINTNALYSFVTERMRNYKNNNFYYNNLYEWKNVVNIIGGFKDIIIMTEDLFKFAPPGQDAIDTFGLMDIYGEEVDPSSITLYMTEYSDNGYSVFPVASWTQQNQMNITSRIAPNGDTIYELLLAGHWIPEEGEYNFEFVVEADDFQKLVISFTLKVMNNPYKLNIDWFCCDMIDLWGSFDFGGYILDNDSNPFEGNVMVNFNITGPSANLSDYWMNSYYNSYDGYFNFNLYPQNNVLPGNYTLGVKIMLEDLGEIDLEFEFERTEYMGPPPINFVIDELSEIVQNEESFKITGSILDELGNPFSSVQQQFFQVWLINSNNETGNIRLSDHDMGGNWTDVTGDYALDFSYDSTDGSTELELYYTAAAVGVEGTYELQFELFIPDLGSYYWFGFRFEREIGEVTDPTDPTNSTSTDTNSTSTDTNSTSANETQTSDPPAGPQISLPAGLPGFEFISIIALMILSVPIIKRRSV